MRINFDKPHSKYCGGGEIPKGAPRGTVYRQGTDYYNGRGDLIKRRAAKPKPAAEPGSVPTEPGSYASMHWTKLRQEMQSRGQVWTNRETAVAYLTETDAAESQAEDNQAEDTAADAIEQPSSNPE